MKFLGIKSIFSLMKEDVNISEQKEGYYELNTDGFSLIEVLIALTIFMFIIGGIVSFSVNSIKASTRSQAMQEAIDNARYTMDDLAKKIRTSSNIALIEDDEIFFVDNKTLTKYCYKFFEDQMLIAKYEPIITTTGMMTNSNATTYNSISSCDDLTEFTSMIGNGANGKVKIGGKFELMKTEINDDDNPHRGFVRVVVDMTYNDSSSPENRAEMHLQSGVSIADYTREDNFELEANVGP